MTTSKALRRLLQLGAENTAELTKALQADQMGSPIAAVRALRAITTALSQEGAGDLAFSPGEREELNGLIASLSESVPGRGRPAIDEPASEHIHLRATHKRKSHYVRVAKSKGQSLAAWAFEALDAASAYEEKT